MSRPYGPDSASPDLMLDTRPIDLSEYAAITLRHRTLVDMKALAPGTAHPESTSTAFSHTAEKRQKQGSPAYHASARSLDV